MSPSYYLLSSIKAGSLTLEWMTSSGILHLDVDENRYGNWTWWVYS